MKEEKATPKWQRWKGIMKAYPFEEKRLQRWTPPFIVQPKYDGVRCRAIQLPNENFILLSSEENVIFSVPHINQALKDQRLKNVELDGELYHHGMSFEEITSRTSRTVNIHNDFRQIQFHIFDIVENESQLQRTIDLERLHLREPLIKSPYWLCESLDSIMKVYNEILVCGYEGIIVRHINAPYVRKRSTLVMKFKPKQEDIYRIKGWKEEIDIYGNSKGQLGALICDSGDGNEFSVGTGFTEEARRSLWDRREELVGKSCKVAYQHITSGNRVPRFPIFSKVIEGR